MNKKLRKLTDRFKVPLFIIYTLFWLSGFFSGITFILILINLGGGV